MNKDFYTPERNPETTGARTRRVPALKIEGLGPLGCLRNADMWGPFQGPCFPNSQVQSEELKLLA